MLPPRPSPTTHRFRSRQSSGRSGLCGARRSVAGRGTLRGAGAFPSTLGRARARWQAAHRGAPFAISVPIPRRPSTSAADRNRTCALRRSGDAPDAISPGGAQHQSCTVASKLRRVTKCARSCVNSRIRERGAPARSARQGGSRGALWRLVERLEPPRSAPGAFGATATLHRRSPRRRTRGSPAGTACVRRPAAWEGRRARAWRWPAGCGRRWRRAAQRVDAPSDGQRALERDRAQLFEQRLRCVWRDYRSRGTISTRDQRETRPRAWPNERAG